METKKSLHTYQTSKTGLYDMMMVALWKKKYFSYTFTPNNN